MSLHRDGKSVTSGSSVTRSVLAGLGFAALSYGAAAIGVAVMKSRRGSAKSTWFRTLNKPSFQPPSWLFGPVWSVLYGAVAYSGWRVWRAPASSERTTALGLWSAQMILNGAWTPLFFGAHKPTIALVDQAALDVAAGLYTYTAAKVDRQAAGAFAPYLGWLGFATVLNATIVANNR